MGTENPSHYFESLRNKVVRKVFDAHEALVMEMQEVSVTGRHLKIRRAESMVAMNVHLLRRYILPKNGFVGQYSTQQLKARRVRLHVNEFRTRSDHFTLLPGKKYAVKRCKHVFSMTILEICMHNSVRNIKMQRHISPSSGGKTETRCTGRFWMEQHMPMPETLGRCFETKVYQTAGDANKFKCRGDRG